MGGAVGGAARLAYEAAGSPTAGDVAAGTGRLAARAVTGGARAAYEVAGGLGSLALEGAADLYETGVRAPQRIGELPTAGGGQTGHEQFGSGFHRARLLTESEIEAERGATHTYRGSGGAHPDHPRVVTDPQPVGRGGGGLSPADRPMDRTRPD